MKLRPYQEEIVSKALSDLAVSGEKPVLHSLSVAAGKSFIAAELARRWYENGLGKVLVLTISKELCQQDYDKLEIVTNGENVGMFSASWGRKETEILTVATVQSAYKNPALWKDYTLVIADEAECFSLSGMAGRLFEHRHVYGITGTPFGTVGSRKGRWFTTKIWPMSKIKDKQYGWYWQPVSYELSAKKMLEMGFHTPLKYFASPINCHLLRLQSNGSEYTLESLDLWVRKTLMRIVEVMQQAEAGGFCHCGIVFLPSVEACELLEAACRERGIFAAAIHSKTPPKERLHIVEQHKAGQLTWLINMNVASRGFDNPAVDCLVLARATGSLRLHIQQLGRGCRIAEGKTVCNVFDLTENTQRWGKLTDLEMGKSLQNGYECDTILLKNKDISGSEVSKIDLTRRSRNGTQKDTGSRDFAQR